jgi:hypothetical protein
VHDLLWVSKHQRVVTRHDFTAMKHPGVFKR